MFMIELRFYSTQNRSFRRRSRNQSLSLVWKNKTEHNKSTHSSINKSVLQHTINTTRTHQKM